MSVAVYGSCRLCGSDRSGPAAIGGLRRCLDCDLLRTGAPGHPPERLYGEEYFERSGYRSYFARAPQWRFEARRRLRWLLAATWPQRLLEAGCAGGFFLEAALQAKIDARGVDVSEAATAFARTLGAAVTTGPFEEAEVEGGFDVLCAFHVLEHVDDPAAFLGRARALLTPGGRLALEVPNAESAEATRAGPAWPHWAPSYHRSHFSPRTLGRVVTAAGFAPERVDTVFARHYIMPRHLAKRPSLAFLARDLHAARSPRTVHPRLGDHIRLLARAR